MQCDGNASSHIGAPLPAGGFDERDENVVAVYQFAFFHRLKYQVVQQIRLDGPDNAASLARRALTQP